MTRIEIAFYIWQEVGERTTAKVAAPELARSIGAIAHVFGIWSSEELKEMLQKLQMVRESIQGKKLLEVAAYGCLIEPSCVHSGSTAIGSCKFITTK